MKICVSSLLKSNQKTFVYLKKFESNFFIVSTRKKKFIINYNIQISAERLIFKKIVFSKFIFK